MLSINCGFDDPKQGPSLLISEGPVLGVQIGFDPQYDATRNAPPNLCRSESLAALVDTGAEASCIDQELARQLRLPLVDEWPVSGVHESRRVDVHLAQIHVPLLKFTIYGRFAAVHLVEMGYKALLGRTFLQHFTMTYDGTTGSVRIERA